MWTSHVDGSHHMLRQRQMLRRRTFVGVTEVRWSSESRMRVPVDRMHGMISELFIQIRSARGWVHPWGPRHLRVVLRARLRVIVGPHDVRRRIIRSLVVRRRRHVRMLIVVGMSWSGCSSRMWVHGRVATVRANHLHGVSSRGILIVRAGSVCRVTPLRVRRTVVIRVGPIVRHRPVSLIVTIVRLTCVIRKWI